MTTAGLVAQAEARPCADCGSEVPPHFLHCPACRALVHGERLRALAAEATSAAEAGDLARAREHWRRALELLPRTSAQHGEVARQIDELGVRIEREGPGRAPAADAHAPDAAADAGTAASHQGAVRAALAGATGAALLVWKFKALLGVALGHGKLLILGLGKGSTFFSMLLSLGVYWTAFGWRFALGLVLSIYVHEIGHVAALRRLGIRATAPMFVPGLGALVRLKEYPASPREDARVGLAGPLFGLAASVCAFTVFLISGAPIFAAIARVGAWLNLFNLIPVWQLDGARGFRALSRGQRVVATGVAAAVGLAVQESLYLLIVAAAGFRVFAADATGAPGDRRALGELLLLLVGLGALCAIVVPGGDALG